jgi:hypothetical protein
MIAPASHPQRRGFLSRGAGPRRELSFRRCYAKGLSLLAASILLASLAFAQPQGQITSIDPMSGKVNDDVTLAGQKLGKTSVTSVYLSDDKNDYKATIVSQADDKIVLKVPHVKAGVYNVSLGTASTIMILPVHFTVQE